MSYVRDRIARFSEVDEMRDVILCLLAYYDNMLRRKYAIAAHRVLCESMCESRDSRYIRRNRNMCWYVLTGYALDKKRNQPIEAQVARYNRESGADIEVFAPTFVKAYNKDKEPRRRLMPMVCQYFFLRGELSQVKDFRYRNREYNLIHDRADTDPDAYMALTDEEMSGFKSLALAYKYKMPCFSLSEVDLVACDKVRIVGGEFAGVEGFLVSQQGRDGGRVIMKVSESLGVETLDINPKYIQVLSFAKGSKRIYDKIDSYIPKLRRAMEYKMRYGDLDVSNTAAVSYFITRFGAANISSAKMRAKVSALLMASYYLMGDTERYEAAKRESLDNLDSCTNTLARDYIMGLRDYCPDYD